MDALAPVMTRGPYASLEAWCDERIARERASLGDLDDETLRREREGEIRCQLGGLARASDRGVGEVRLVSVDTAGDAIPGDRKVAIAIHRVAGWYVAEDVARAKALLGEDHEITGASVQRLAVAGGRVIAEVVEHEALSGDPRGRRFLIVCGVGASGAPSCTPPILLDDTPEAGAATHLRYALGDDGGLARDGTRDDAPVHERHALAFP